MTWASVSIGVRRRRTPRLHSPSRVASTRKDSSKEIYNDDVRVDGRPCAAWTPKGGGGIWWCHTTGVRRWSVGRTSPWSATTRDTTDLIASQSDQGPLIGRYMPTTGVFIPQHSASHALRLSCAASVDVSPYRPRAARRVPQGVPPTPRSFTDARAGDCGASAGRLPTARFT